jgi:hypothetical protein
LGIWWVVGGGEWVAFIFGFVFVGAHRDRARFVDLIVRAAARWLPDLVSPAESRKANRCLLLVPYCQIRHGNFKNCGLFA